MRIVSSSLSMGMGNSWRWLEKDEELSSRCLCGCNLKSGCFTTFYEKSAVAFIAYKFPDVDSCIVYRGPGQKSPEFSPQRLEGC